MRKRVQVSSYLTTEEIRSCPGVPDSKRGACTMMMIFSVDSEALGFCGVAPMAKECEQIYGDFLLS
jgi:hypothetical protein